LNQDLGLFRKTSGARREKVKNDSPRRTQRTQRRPNQGEFLSVLSVVKIPTRTAKPLNQLALASPRRTKQPKDRVPKYYPTENAESIALPEGGT
jgi:hypothetical protein